MGWVHSQRGHQIVHDVTGRGLANILWKEVGIQGIVGTLIEKVLSATRTDLKDQNPSWKFQGVYSSL